MCRGACCFRQKMLKLTSLLITVLIRLIILIRVADEFPCGELFSSDYTTDMSIQSFTGVFFSSNEMLALGVWVG